MNTTITIERTVDSLRAMNFACSLRPTSKQVWLGDLLVLKSYVYESNFISFTPGNRLGVRIEIENKQFPNGRERLTFYINGDRVSRKKVEVAFGESK